MTNCTKGTDKVNRDLYLLASSKLLELSKIDSKQQQDILDAIASMGPADFLSDLTDGQLTGAIQFMDWILSHHQFNRGTRAQ